MDAPCVVLPTRLAPPAGGLCRDELRYTKGIDDGWRDDKRQDIVGASACGLFELRDPQQGAADGGWVAPVRPVPPAAGVGRRCR